MRGEEGEQEDDEEVGVGGGGRLMRRGRLGSSVDFLQDSDSLPVTWPLSSSG